MPRGRPKRRNTSTSEASSSTSTQPPNGIVNDTDKPFPYPPPTFLRPTNRIADWDKYLQLPEGLNRARNIASVSLFKHAPLADIWEKLTKQNTGKQLVVEVPNIYIQHLYKDPVSWFATIRGYAGYRCLIEYDNLDNGDVRYMEWATFCSDVMRPLGHSTKNRVPMLPPFDPKEVPDFYKKGLERNSGKPTVAQNHGARIAQAITKKQRYKIGTVVEAVDMITHELSIMKVAAVVGYIGDRMCVRYVNTNKYHYFNVNSEFVHPLGWSQMVGHDIEDIPSNCIIPPLDLSYFPSYDKNVKLELGQYLEIRHPVQTHKICAAKICKIYKHGYFQIVTDSFIEEADDDPWKICYHLSSPYILSCGFCKRNAIELMPPFGENAATFSWERFFSRYNTKAAPLDLLPKRSTPKFTIGMKLEAADETDPKCVGPVTIVNIKEHLLWIHFDCWITGIHDGDEVEAEKWMDCESPNIYPVGYCEMTMHNFHGCVEIQPPTHPTIKYNALAESLAGASSTSTEVHQNDNDGHANNVDMADPD